MDSHSSRQNFLLTAAFHTKDSNPILSRHFILELLSHLYENSMDLNQGTWNTRLCTECGNIYGINTIYKMINHSELKIKQKEENNVKMEGKGKCTNYLVIECEICGMNRIFNGQQSSSENNEHSTVISSSPAIATISASNNLQQSVAKSSSSSSSSSLTLLQQKERANHPSGKPKSLLSKTTAKTLNKIIKKSNQTSTLNLQQFLK